MAVWLGIGRSEIRYARMYVFICVYECEIDVGCLSVYLCVCMYLYKVDHATARVKRLAHSCL